MKVTIIKFAHVSVQSNFNYETSQYEDQHTYAFYDQDLTNNDYGGYGICLGPVSIELELPSEFVYVDALAVALLKAERDKLTAAFHKKVSEINEKLNRYTAIEG